ncbi:cytochrome b5-like heme/steroid binding domain-containing protein [Agrococcus beijingensis]|uniref:cytochrome b5-like heme/steroid binding domain-containing protein n=1 Tax=Agrococcus beijingensis TaxID=3068634 RepID=UPI0027418C0E|nr:cytochrome b5-like heme/steroid binding domain-containing protein [Agrococcus sp. REN33]
MLPIAATGNPFDLFAGLPLHPLAVHVPVVLLPLGAMGLLLMLVVVRWRTVLAWPVIVMLGMATGGALVAKLSGEALALRVGDPGQHAELGNWLLATAGILFTATLAWWLWQRRQARVRRPTGVVGLIVGTVLATLAVGAVIIAVLTGHSGATAAWGDRVGVQTPDASAPEATGAPSAAPTGGEDISIATVAQHDDSASCWVAIEGTVYDVTEWIPQHPGGPDRILGICGTDASDDFGAQHSGDALPTEQLSQFAIGELAER